MVVYTRQKNIAQVFILERYFFVSIYPAAIPGTYLVVRDNDIKVKIYSVAELRFIYELLTSLETHSKRNISTTISWNSITMEVLNRIA